MSIEEILQRNPYFSLLNPDNIVIPSIHGLTMYYPTVRHNAILMRGVHDTDFARNFDSNWLPGPPNFFFVGICWIDWEVSLRSGDLQQNTAQTQHRAEIEVENK